ncbi:MAG: glucose-6-phosphate isomerase [Phycisphaerae bacterium]|nr:glucose-6-phosphate isomerase [Phycisphaerae bacterium]
MAKNAIALEYGATLVNAVGPEHGLTLDEIDRSTPRLAAIVDEIERERAGGKHRYRELPTDREMLREVKSAIDEYEGEYENLVILGIGGSALGNIALQTALNSPYYNLLSKKQRGGPRLFVMDNVDPVQFSAMLEVIGPDLKRTLFNVISKSGETAETASQFLTICDLLQKKLGVRGLRRQMVVTTDPKSGTMRQIVDKAGFAAMSVPDGVGGRFSVLSAVGLFSAGMCGIDIKALLAGAAEMSRRAANPVVRENPAALLALLLHEHYARGKRLHVMMSYSYQLKDLADWYCQLWAESLGKNVDIHGRPQVIGPTPIRAVGTTDQHSQVQLYREGPNDKVFILLAVDRFSDDVKIPKIKGVPQDLEYLQGSSMRRLLNAEREATEFALVSSQRPCLTIRFPEIDAFAVGQFMMLWEATATVAGKLFELNPYDQPAVQLGKEYTFALMGKAGFDAQRTAYQAFVEKRGDYSV